MPRIKDPKTSAPALRPILPKPTLVEIFELPPGTIILAPSPSTPLPNEPDKLNEADEPNENEPIETNKLIAPKKQIKKRQVCPICGVSFLYPACLHKHIIGHQDSEACSRCGQTLDPREDWYEHIQGLCPKIQSNGVGYNIPVPEREEMLEFVDFEVVEDFDENLPEAGTDSYAWPCSYCSQVLKTEGSRAHHEGGHGEGFPCPFCPTSFKVQAALARHKSHAHRSRIVTFSCSYCGKISSNRREYEEHGQKCADGDSFIGISANSRANNPKRATEGEDFILPDDDEDEDDIRSFNKRLKTEAVTYTVVENVCSSAGGGRRKQNLKGLLNPPAASSTSTYYS